MGRSRLYLEPGQANSLLCVAISRKLSQNPNLEGTVVRMLVEKLPSGGVNEPKPAQPGPGRSARPKEPRPEPRHDVGRIHATGEAHSRPTHQRLGTKPRRPSQH